ncbi:MAG: DUF1475 family protein [Mariniphaga sp.]
MKLIKLLAITGTLVMFFTLMYGFIYGDFFGEGGILMSMAWGKVSLVDVYIGFFLFSGWVLYREERLLVAIFWISQIMVLGNFITCLYVTMALYNSKENWNRFWLGKQHA